MAKKTCVIAKDTIKKEISGFYNLIKDAYPVKKMILYGSYAKGSATKDSDIDVGVIIDLPDSVNKVEITANLFHIARKIDSHIEPLCILWSEYKNHERGSILSEIIKTGVEIV